MQEQQNIDLIKKLYGAFSAGDIDALINHLAPTNKTFDVATVHVFTIKDGKVTRYLDFTDSARVAEAYTAG